MALQASYFVQAFTMNRGQLKFGKRDLAPFESGANKRADAWAAREMPIRRVGI